MSSIAGPCLFHHGGVSKTSVRTGLQLKPCRSGSIVEVTTTTTRLRVSAIAAQVAEDGDTKSVVGKETKLKEASPLSAKKVPNYESDEDDEDEDEVHGGSREVYMISDGPGWTADHAVQAALGQFENCFVDQRCSVDTHLFSQINEVGRLMEIIRQAAQEQALVFYTLADPYMAEAADKACEMLHVPHVNILGPITDALQSHLGVSPSGIPRGAPGRKSILSKQYFKRIEAVEFTIRQDDGVLPKNIINADIVLTGVSRTSKTPLSTYLAQKGYKVANVPLVLGIDPPKELFEVNQDKVFGLTINPTDLKSIRIARSLTLGITGDGRTKYADMEHIRKELEYSRQLFLENPRWPVVEVTGKSIEETAAVILRIFHERRSKHLMPRISRRYAFRGEQDKYYENNNRTNLQLEAKALAGGVIALGKFDALHVGHRALAERAAELGEPFLVSFAGMAQVLGWEVRLPVVAPCDRTRVMSLWAKHCSDMVPREYMLEFAKVRSLSPEQFVAKLAFELKVKGVVAGANYRFGYKAAGDASDLVRLCQEHGLQSAIVNPVMDGVVVTDNAAAPVLDQNSCREKGQVSTTRVRKALANGDMKRVAELLGRNHRLVFQPGNYEVHGNCITIPLSCALNQPPRIGSYECSFILENVDFRSSAAAAGHVRIDEDFVSLVLQGPQLLDTVAQQRQIVLDFLA